MYRFKWSEGLVGLSLAVVGLLVGGVQAGLTRVVNPKIGDKKSIYLGLLMSALGLTLFAFANQTWMMFAFLVPYCLGGIANPSLQSILAGYIPPSQQGELQGALTSLMSLTTIIGPLVMNNLFTYFTGDKAPFHFPGISFLLGAVLTIVALWVAWDYLKHHKPAFQPSTGTDEVPPSPH